MSERGSFRGRGRGGGRDGGDGGGHRAGGRGGARGGAHGGQQQERPKKENILDLTKYMDKEINVKFNGGRESIRDLNLQRTGGDADFAPIVVGILKGYDQLMNLVLDDVRETMKGP